MDREARHVMASHGGNRRTQRRPPHGVPGFLWRISKCAEQPQLTPEEKLRLPKVSILFPYGSVTRSPPFLSLSLRLSLWFSHSSRFRSLLRSLYCVISLSLTHIALHHSLSPILSFSFAVPSLARAVFCLFLSLFLFLSLVLLCP